MHSLSFSRFARKSRGLRVFAPAVLALLMLGASGCGVQSIPKALNALDASVAEVTNQYKRRADLIPNLVSTVKGYASHEQETLTAERYPDLKADRNFRELQAQLEGTENRITIARQRHIEAIRRFNDLVTVPPTSLVNSLLYHHEKQPQWSLDANEQKAVEKAPEVAF